MDIKKDKRIAENSRRWRSSHLELARERARLGMRKIRMMNRALRLIEKGLCPICEMMLTADYHIRYGQECIVKMMYLLQGLEVPKKIVHAKIGKGYDLYFNKEDKRNICYLPTTRLPSISQASEI